ncbi:MAG: hypothetical protein ACXVHQ_41045, partial [Solirubrobacteraceae bacterium]
FTELAWQLETNLAELSREPWTAMPFRPIEEFHIWATGGPPPGHPPMFHPYGDNIDAERASRCLKQEFHRQTELIERIALVLDAVWDLEALVTRAGERGSGPRA